MTTAAPPVTPGEPERSRIDQLEAALANFHACDVQAVTCELICLGLVEFDRAVRLGRSTLVSDDEAYTGGEPRSR